MSPEKLHEWRSHQAWVFIRCGHESGGYPDEAAAERAEETHGLFEHSRPPREEAGDEGT